MVISPPSSISTIRLKAKLIVLFPAPVLPTMPTFSPPLIVKFNPFKTNSVSGLYLKKTFLNSIFPYSGQFGLSERSGFYGYSPLI